MLAETHPLYDAQLMMSLWFQSAPENHLIEFQAPIVDGDPRGSTIPATVVNACRVKNFEQAFDNAIAPWIMRTNAEKRQAFFSVCPRSYLRQSEKGRWRTGQKGDVSHAVGAWVDLDTDRWEKLLEKEKPPFTFIVATGGGAHMYFRYDRALPVQRAVGDSKALAAKYGGDHCWNENRLLRVPGTKNWKGWWTKHPLGRPCRLHLSQPEQTYAGLLNGTGDGTVPDFWTLNEDVRHAILNGHDAAYTPVLPPGTKAGEVDRSQIDHRIMIRLFLSGWDEDAVRGVFVNPDNGISAKYFDEGANGDHYLAVSMRSAAAKADAQKSASGDIGPVMDLESPEKLATAPKTQFLVDTILPASGLMILSGPSKVGKSLLVTDLILLLAGVPGKFLDRFDVHVPGRVAYYQAEISRSSLKGRFEIIAGSRGHDWSKFPVFTRTGRFDLSDNNHFKSLVVGLKKNNIQYLVVDPLARFHTRNENSSAEMGGVLSNLDKAAQEAGCLGTILIHHHGKPSDAKREGAYQLRGASVISDWGNSHVIVQKRFSDSTGRKYAQILFELRDADEPEPFTLQLNKESLRFGNFSPEEERLAVTMGVIEVAGEKASRKEIVADIVDRLGVKKYEAERLAAKATAKIKAAVPPATLGAPPDVKTGPAGRDPGAQDSQTPPESTETPSGSP